MWARTTWDLPVAREFPFSFDLIPEPVVRTAQEAVQQYLFLPGTELWSINICDNTLAQIEYHVYSNGIKDDETALLLCDRLVDWVYHMKNMAAAGGKFLPEHGPETKAAEFNLFHNEMVYNNITGLIRSDTVSVVYSAFCNPSFLVSSDEKICEFTRSRFDNVLQKSTSLSVQGEKSREWFFGELENKIRRVGKRLELHLAEKS